MSNGPFYYVPGSHHVNERKMRWLWHRSRHDTNESLTTASGSPRHVAEPGRSQAHLPYNPTAHTGLQCTQHSHLYPQHSSH
jgi:hypothetical protein